MLKRRCTFCSSVNVIITKAAYNRPEYSCGKGQRYDIKGLKLQRVTE
jgi:hypothetical protein